MILRLNIIIEDNQNVSVPCIRLVMTLDVECSSSLVCGGCYGNCFVHHIFVRFVCFNDIYNSMEYNVTYRISYDFLKTCTPALILNSPVKGLILQIKFISSYLSCLTFVGISVTLRIDFSFLNPLFITFSS